MSETVERHVLARYQAQAVERIGGALDLVAAEHVWQPEHRRKIGREMGVILLEAPTGSGKTLVLARALEGAKGQLPCKTVWFWFAPYTGIVSQTLDVLAAQSAQLRLRDITIDREPKSARDGDVFIQTWAAVAARNKQARRARREAEDTLSLDSLIEHLRLDGFFIGVVIDEAHLNFGASAKAAGAFYLDILQPDFTLLATATPNDDKLRAFEQAAQVVVGSRVVIERAQVVEAGLNKRGLMLGYLSYAPEDDLVVDHEWGTLMLAWTQHRMIRKRLADLGIGLKPLMLVQVEDQVQGGLDPVERIKTKLLEIGVESDAIAVHTSGEPDPLFHSLAYDDRREVLVFKVAVATGFDAPRAWTLVSVRPNRGIEFGMQIVGRIMRVHPLVRRLAASDPDLARGYVFLSDPTMQSGLDHAVDELKAVRQSVSMITDRLNVVSFGPSTKTLGAIATPSSLPAPRPIADDADRQARFTALLDDNMIDETFRSASPALLDQAILQHEAVRDLCATPLFGENLPTAAAPGHRSAQPRIPDKKKYILRKELELPKALWREVPPDNVTLNDPAFLTDIARAFCDHSEILALLNVKRRKANAQLRDLFNEGELVSLGIQVNLSSSRIAAQAQSAFQFNDSISPIDLKRSLVAELERRAEEAGHVFTQTDLRRAIDMAAMKQPDMLKNACRAATAKHVLLVDDEEIPAEIYDDADLEPAQKSAYGVIPGGLNKEERAFAQLIDQDQTGTVRWWLKNIENTNWATRLILPSGKRFFPDFAIGVAGRSTPDAVALVEIKDDGLTGRLHSEANTEKIRVPHRKYAKICWVCRGSGGLWERLEFNANLNRIQPIDAFKAQILAIPN